MTAVWLRDPLAILANGAERGIVVENGAIPSLDVPALVRRHGLAALAIGQGVS